MEKTITYFGQRAKVACDENCGKAWGVNDRPRVYLDQPEKIYGLDDDGIWPDESEKEIDHDDYAYLSDGELGAAPENPGTYEGGFAKPIDKSEIGNRWCIRQCERCVMSSPGKSEEPLVLPDFSKRIYNIKQNDPEYFKDKNT